MVAPGSTEEHRVEALLKDKWAWWLETRYGTVAAMKKLYGSAYANFADIPGSIGFLEKSFDIYADDFRN